MASPALAPVWWVTRWVARFVATTAMTAFTALTLAVGTGPAFAADLPPTTPARPASVTLALHADVTDAPADQPDTEAHPAASAEPATAHPAAGWGRGWHPTTGALPGAVGQRAPPSS